MGGLKAEGGRTRKRRAAYDRLKRRWSECPIYLRRVADELWEAAGRPESKEFG